MALILTTMPVLTLSAEEGGTTETEVESPEGSTTVTENNPENATATTTEEGGNNATTTNEDPDMATSTDGSTQTATSTGGDIATSSESGGVGGSTEDGESGGSSEPGTGDNAESGAEGDGGEGMDGETASTTNTATTTNSGEAGTEGESGTEGVNGLPGEPVPVLLDNLIGDNDTPEDEDVTGGVVRSGRNAFIETGMATAQGDVTTDANSTNVRSELEDFVGDLDTYTFIATGTNEAVIDNDAVMFSSSGENDAFAINVSSVKSGKAVSALNIANIVNSNIINSDGLIYLANQILEAGQSLDLSGFFFPDEAETRLLSSTCSLISCSAEDVIYNIAQANTAELANNAVIDANSGENISEGNYAEIETGDAYGGANVINVVNTNIIDSNYRLLTFNAIGNLDGDLVLPTAELFQAFFSRPNGINQLETLEDMHINVSNGNLAEVDNNLDTYAETGLNNSTTAFPSQIISGDGSAESNVLNKINENVYGGDSMYLLIRIHGYWDGQIVGLPPGLSWEETPDGIVIYNTDAEISPSELLQYDIDTYTANITNQNNVVIDNNISINAITGKNTVDGLTGLIETGDAFASANVMNIANTNIIGTNWTMAIVNILGNFEGDISFSEIDLALEGEIVQNTNTISPGEVIDFNYTITNNSEVDASGVTLRQLLQGAYVTGTQTEQVMSIGRLGPGESKRITLSAFVDPGITYGTTSVTAMAVVDSNEAETNSSDNIVQLSLEAVYPTPVIVSTSTNPTNSGGGTTTTGGNVITSSPSGGGGGGGSTSRTKKVDRTVTKVNPNDPPLITITKKADVGEGVYVKAGEEVDYTIIVTNKGGTAYDAIVYDTLLNPIGSIMNEQSWNLETILPGEVIELTYTTTYSSTTPSGEYINTASIEAYLKEGSKKAGGKAIKIKDAVHHIVINGVDLAVGNVGVIAYFPGPNGLTSALIAWETSKPALSRVFFSQTGVASPYSEHLPNFGYGHASFQFPITKTKHYMILTGLKNGTEYVYRVRAVSDSSETMSREYSYYVPNNVLALTLPVPGQTPQPKVAGASTTTTNINLVTPQPPASTAKPAVKPTPPKAVKLVPTQPKPLPESVAVALPRPLPEVVTEPDMKTGEVKEGASAKTDNKGFTGLVDKVFGWFR